MLKKVTQIALCIIMLVCAVLVDVTVGEIDQDFPEGYSYAINVNVSSSSSPKRQLIENIDEWARESRITPVLVKPGTTDVIHVKNLYYFGQKPKRCASGDCLVSWYQRGMKGRYLPASEIKALNLSGTYLFHDSNQCFSFSRFLRGQGVTIEENMQKNDHLLAYMWRSHSTIPFLAVAALLFIVSLVWAFLAEKMPSVRIKTQSGLGKAEIAAQSVYEFLRYSSLQLLLLLLLSCLILSILHKFYLFGFVIKYLLIFFLGLLLLPAFFISISTVVTFPSTHQIAIREGAPRASLVGSIVIKVLSTIVVVSVFPTALANFGVARQQLGSVSRWRQISHAVNLQIDPSEKTEDSYARKLVRVAYRMEGKRQAALSYSAANSIAQNSRGTIDAGLMAPYDSIAVMNPTFLTSLHIQEKSLCKVQPSMIDPALAGKIRQYDDLWLAKGSTKSMTDMLYSPCQGSHASIPVLLATGGVGTFSLVHKPLIILVKDLKVLDSDQFLYPAMTTGNLFFTQPDGVEEALHQENAQQAVYAINSIVDDAVLASQIMEYEVYLDFILVITACMAIILCAVISSRLWMIRKRRWIFVRRTSGEPYLSIISSYLLQAVFIIAGSLTLSQLLFAHEWQAVSHPVLAVVMILLAFIGLECGFAFFHARQAFAAMIHRE